MQETDSIGTAPSPAPPQNKSARITVKDLPLLAGLRKGQLEALMIVAVRGLRYDHTALELKCSIGTIKSRVSRARARLQELLSDASEESRDPKRIAAWRRAEFAIFRLGQDEPVNPGIEDELATIESMARGEMLTVAGPGAQILKSLSNLNPR